MILSTSGINYRSISHKYLGFTIFCMIFSTIYELFSHQVYSNFMIFSFLIPLFMGFMVTMILNRKKIIIDPLSFSMYHASIITFTFASIMKGILDIYGTTNNLLYIYIVIGILMLILSIINILRKIL